jgi:hypothetical protein
MSDYTQVVILCEDRQQEVFARHFLIQCGVNRHRIRVNVAPSGLGSGEQHVRENFPDEVQSYRSRSYLNIALTVLIDADTYSVRDRFRQLNDELINRSLSERQPDERIGIFIPKRNIDTWIHYLQGESVNEVDVYPKLEKEGDCKHLVTELAESRHQSLPNDAPGSLRTACSELSQIGLISDDK